MNTPKISKHFLELIRDKIIFIDSKVFKSNQAKEITIKIAINKKDITLHSIFL
jgi:hypothetical protein